MLGFHNKDKRPWKFLEEMNKNMYVFGASGHGKVVAEAAETAGMEVSGFIDENPNLSSLLDLPVLKELPLGAKEMVISVGKNEVRKKIVDRFPNLVYPKIIHAFSFVSKRAAIGDGTVILSGVSVNSEAKVGKHCILNTNSSIDHDCELGDFVHISPNAALAGDVAVGEGTHIGIGAAVIQGVKIGKWAVIGAGAVIIRDVPDFAVMVGNPAKQIKTVENTNTDR
ncbi:acetyltransferase [Moheibacter lacus]|nr:acetyltransferase [Moheibacter lacus]